MAEALAQVKRRFGRDALILNTRTFTQGGFMGFGGKTCVEITAAPPGSSVAYRPRRRTTPAGSGGGRGDGPPPTRPAPQPALAPLQETAFLKELGQVKSMVQNLVHETRRARAQQVPDELFDSYRALIEREVAESVADQLIEQVRCDLTDAELRAPATVRARLAQALEEMLPVAGPIQLRPAAGPTVIALIGPTGVGKTTTVAKLAANFCLRDRKSVGLITIDTYRIAAVEQLRTYAQIIDVPLEVVVTPEELKDAVERMADRDVVLIDTAGRSQRDSAKIAELQQFFAAVRPHEVHLVLSGTCGSAVLREAIERFNPVGVDRVIFTKLDEALGFGVVLSCLQQADARLSYVTTGQDVPEDIEVGQGRRLAALILAGSDKPVAGSDKPATAGDRPVAAAGRSG